MLRKRGFTLIELLIVVAIIAILAAIAVPNFLEAQVRSKISRVKADMRSILLAGESYRIDNNKYMPDNVRVSGNAGGQIRPDMSSWTYLTTPIAYMSSVPTTPFKEYKSKDSNPPWTSTTELPNPGNYPEYWNGNFQGDGTYKEDAGAKETGMYWRGSSVGPDNLSDFHNQYGVSGAAFNPKDIRDRKPNFIKCIYDPSNGTTSRGDLFITNQGFVQ